VAATARQRNGDGLAVLGKTLGAALNRPVKALWNMQNGYALCTRAGLDGIAEHLSALQPDQLDLLRGQLRIGIHRDVEVTDAEDERRPIVSQAFCSALPVAYSIVPPSYWEAFASPVLQAAYEATMWAGALNAQRGASNVVLLTQLGGGAFGNQEDWISNAMLRSLELMSEFNLEVRLVCYGTPSRAIVHVAEHFGRRNAQRPKSSLL
jgi:hypothetical protein